ncbi:hypothetical protein HK405_012784, partial [Cladochytrium tenue]
MLKRADVNQSWNGLTALHIAATKNWPSIVQVLLDSGADPTVPISLRQYALLRRFKASATALPTGPAPFPLSSASSPTEHPADALPRRGSATPLTVAPLAAAATAAAAAARSTSVNSTPPNVSVTEPGGGVVGGGSVMSASFVDPLAGSRNSSPASAPQSPLSAVPPPPPPQQVGFPYPRQAGTTPAPEKNTYNGWPLDSAGDLKIYPVELAAACGNIESVKMLLSRMDPKVVATLTFALLAQRDPEMIGLFLRHGTVPDQRDAYGSTALHLASRCGDAEAAQVLLLGGADVNSRGQNG